MRAVPLWAFGERAHHSPPIGEGPSQDRLVGGLVDQQRHGPSGTPSISAPSPNVQPFLSDANARKSISTRSLCAMSFVTVGFQVSL